MAKKKAKEEVVIEQPQKWVNCEWCFQFDDDEPQIFAWTDDEMDSEENPEVTFTISNNKDSYIGFTNVQNGKAFKLFSRELTEEGKALRARSKELTKEKNQ